jgi:hypothetical protein
VQKSCGDAEICALEAAGSVLLKNRFDNVAKGGWGYNEAAFEVKKVIATWMGLRNSLERMSIPARDSAPSIEMVVFLRRKKDE